ncbi:hypothetical protein [Sphingobium yanoikuyae]|uniref:hypothetical protein n=1 Tax=Sphingobium yanoikuyae TaxID=13690 RepID=UPI003D766B03
MAIDAAPSASAERRIDQDQRRSRHGRQQVVDILPIMARDGLIEDARKQVGPAGVEFIKEQPGADAPCVDGEHPGPRGRFEHDVFGPCLGGQARQPGKRSRRTELLEIDLAFGPVGLGR